ncbi:hypothetical protein LOY92_001711 [Ophidiomyces ophidiicola]|nr:hypothetical protein LOY92_001711 [Ophidiomyces ophidiicola]
MHTLDALADTTAAEKLEDAMRTVATEEMDDAPTTISAALAPRRILRPVDGEVPGAGIKVGIFCPPFNDFKFSVI